MTEPANVGWKSIVQAEVSRQIRPIVAGLILILVVQLAVLALVLTPPPPAPVFKKGQTTLPYRRAPEIRPERKVWT